jgi:hypothetical protein
MTRIVASVLGLALVASLSSEPLPTRVKAHGIALTGTVSSVDDSHKSFAVRNSAGKETRLVWTDATKVVGGKVSAGAKVTLRYLDKDGKHIATSVVIGEPGAARTPAPGPAPTAASH